MAGSFPAVWIHGSADCATNADPPLQVHAYDADTYILRQNKCLNYEAPFLYLLIGSEKALLLDTGAAPPPGVAWPLRSTVDGILADRPVHRIVAHTHAHGDHAFGDAQFVGRAVTTVVAPDRDSVRAFFGLSAWPDGEAVLELGGRPLTVFPLPGHELSHIGIHDPTRGLLLTGDTLYPGLLVINDWRSYRHSAERLARLAASHPITHVLGAHIEMKRTAGELYPVGTRYQPEEHELALTGRHLQEWCASVAALGDAPRRQVHADFILQPRTA